MFITFLVFISRLGIYVPEGLRGMAHIMGYKDRRRKLVPNAKSGHRPLTYKHNYKNYKPFNPVQIKEDYLYANRHDQHKKVQNVEIKQ